VYERIELKDNIKSSETAETGAKCLYYNRKVDYVYVVLGPHPKSTIKHWYILRTIAAGLSIPRIVLSQYPHSSPSVAIIERSPEAFPVQMYEFLAIASSTIPHFDSLSVVDLAKRLTWSTIEIQYMQHSHLEVGIIGYVQGVSKNKRVWEELVVSLLAFRCLSE
jgi:hypothetical protein